MTKTPREWVALLVPPTVLLSATGIVAHNSHHLGEHPWIDLATRAFFGVVGLLVGVALGRPWALRTKAAILAGALAGFAGGALIMTLQGTTFSYGVVYGDAGFITAYVAKFASSYHLGDFFYANLPSYYPPLFYWLLGRASALTHIEPYAMVKHGLIVATVAVPLLTYSLWRRLVGRPLAALLSASVLIYQDLDKPAAWLAQVIFVPWWLLFVEGQTTGRSLRPTARYVIGGLLGGAIIELNYYCLFVAVIALAIELGRDAIDGGLRSAWRRLGPLLPLAAVMLSVSAPYWLPFLLSLRIPGAMPMQARWFEPSMADLKLPFLEFSPEGVLGFAGVVYAFAAYRADRVAATLLRLLGASYAWFALGWFATLAKHPLLSFKTWYLVHYLLAMMGLLAAGRLWQARGKLAGVELRRLAQAVVALLLVFVGQRFPNRDATDLRGVQPPHPSIANLKELMGPTWEGSQILTSFWVEIQFVPLYVFLAENPYYSHPAALVTQRGQFVERMGRETDPGVLEVAIRHNRYGRIDGLLLNQEREVRFYRDDFPHPAVVVDVHLSNSALAAPYFTQTVRGGQYFYLPEKEADPLERLDIAHLEQVPLETLAVAYVASLTYPDDVKLGIDVNPLKQELVKRSTAESLSARTRALMARAGLAQTP